MENKITTQKIGNSSFEVSSGNNIVIESCTCGAVFSWIHDWREHKIANQALNEFRAHHLNCIRDKMETLKA